MSSKVAPKEKRLSFADIIAGLSLVVQYEEGILALKIKKKVTSITAHVPGDHWRIDGCGVGHGVQGIANLHTTCIRVFPRETVGERRREKQVKERGGEERERAGFCVPSLSNPRSAWPQSAPFLP